MEKQFLEIQSFVLIPETAIPEQSTKQSLILAAKFFPEFSHIPGTAEFSSEKHPSESGPFWKHQFGFSTTSYISQDREDKINDTGAIILHTDIETLVFWQNDRFANAPMIRTIKSDADRTTVTFELNSLYKL